MAMAFWAFPKCFEAHIKDKGSKVGFVEFKTAGDAKSGKSTGSMTEKYGRYRILKNVD